MTRQDVIDGIESLCSIESLSNDGRLPLVVTPTAERPLSEFVPVFREWIPAQLLEVGGILFRGFLIAAAADFEGFVKAITPDLVTYEFGSTPRSQVHNLVYTSTEYPPHQHIPLHNEQAYTVEWPMKIWFCCILTAPEGGITPIADSRRVFDKIPETIKDRFTRKRVRYVRNYGNGLDVPWQKVFNTTDRGTVESYCRQGGIICEWKADGELRTTQICQAVATHPRTKESVWFNQAHLFHVTNLEPAVREALLAVVDEKDLPRQTYYGDGTPIEQSVLDEIREVYRSVSVQFPWQNGDVLLLDNMLAAHGRTPFKGPRKVLVAMAEPYSPLRGLLA